MKLVIGIGNPGLDYADTRHNVGYMVVDKVAEKLAVPFGRSQYRALAAEGRHAGEKTLLLKPLTFVNLSGESARIACQKNGIDPSKDLLVISDDADLEPGVMRFRSGGSTGGHNGLKSVAEAVGPGFARLRMGIGRSNYRLRDHVLSVFSPDEAEIMSITIARAADAVLDWIAKGITYCQNSYNKKTDGSSKEPAEERSQSD